MRKGILVLGILLILGGFGAFAVRHVVQGAMSGAMRDRPDIVRNDPRGLRNMETFEDLCLYGGILLLVGGAGMTVGAVRRRSAPTSPPSLPPH